MLSKPKVDTFVKNYYLQYPNDLVKRFLDYIKQYLETFQSDPDVRAIFPPFDVVDEIFTNIFIWQQYPSVNSFVKGYYLNHPDDLGNSTIITI